MKVEVNENKKEQEIEFPCLVIHKDNEEGNLILWRVNKDLCLIIESSGEWSFTQFKSDNNWNWEEFIPFKGSITLSND